MTQPSLLDLPAPTDAPLSPVKKERSRLHAANLRVLAFLQARGAQGATNWELTTPEVGGCEAIRRLRELRAAGYAIRGPVKQEGKGTTRYFFEGVQNL